MPLQSGSVNVIWQSAAPSCGDNQHFIWINLIFNFVSPVDLTGAVILILVAVSTLRPLKSVASISRKRRWFTAKVALAAVLRPRRAIDGVVVRRGTVARRVERFFAPTLRIPPASPGVVVIGTRSSLHLLLQDHPPDTTPNSLKTVAPALFIPSCWETSSRGSVRSRRAGVGVIVGLWLAVWLRRVGGKSRRPQYVLTGPALGGCIHVIIWRKDETTEKIKRESQRC